MKPVIYITPSGAVHFIAECPEEPKHSIIHYQQFANPVLERKTDIAVCRQALAAAKKNFIPFEDQEQAREIVIGDYLKRGDAPPFKYRGSLVIRLGECVCPFPSDQYKVEIKWVNQKGSVSGKAEAYAVAVLSPLKPQEDKLISEPKDMKETALTTEEIEGLKTVGIVSANWYAVCVDKNTAPFALFDCLEYAEAYRKQFLATAIIEPWPMIVKDYRKPRNPQANEK